METKVISAASPGALETALDSLRRGGLVAFPTDTVYGLGAAAFDGAAVKSIYAAKGRSGEKAIPVLLGDAGDLERVAVRFSDSARRLAERFWPGPLTLVVLKQPGLPEEISANDTVGVRVPDHDLARQLLRLAGPLAVTSANLSGRASPRTAEEVRQQLSGLIGLIIDGGGTPGGVPSTVLDCTKPKPEIIREGPITAEAIRSALD